ncbi:hypothetical protein JHK82_035308 [Glycine max]|nr:hypothetical protein JHK85_036033 [Glycine max]KAG5112039.1 hypothetical protein JHK82_035308 [Glycine max]
MTVVAAGSDCQISAPTVFPVVLVLGIVLPFLFVRITILKLESVAACSSLGNLFLQLFTFLTYLSYFVFIFFFSFHFHNNLTLSSHSIYLIFFSLVNAKLCFFKYVLNKLSSDWLFHTQKGLTLPPSTTVRASLTDVKPGVSLEEKQLPKGETWSVHKFGGTCVGTSQRIKNVADIILKDDSGRKLVVVSAMSKVKNMMYDLIHKAQSRDESYIAALDSV